MLKSQIQLIRDSRIFTGNGFVFPRNNVNSFNILLASHINNPISNAVSSIYYNIKTYMDPLTVKSCFVQKNSYLLLYSDCQFFHFISQDLFLNFLETEWQRKLEYMLSLFSLSMPQMDTFIRKQYFHYKPAVLLKDVNNVVNLSNKK